MSPKCARRIQRKPEELIWNSNTSSFKNIITKQKLYKWVGLFFDYVFRNALCWLLAILGAKPVPDEYNNEIFALLQQHTKNEEKELRINLPDLMMMKRWIENQSTGSNVDESLTLSVSSADSAALFWTERQIDGCQYFVKNFKSKDESSWAESLLHEALDQ